MLRHVLRLYSCGIKKLIFHKYISYHVGGSLKTVGILQFKTRYSPTTLTCYFAQDDVIMDVLLPVNKPLVLVHMRVWILSQYHEVLDSVILIVF
jgi:hypothetical protein